MRFSEIQRDTNAQAIGNNQREQIEGNRLFENMNTYVPDPTKPHDEIQRDTGEMENITTGAYQCSEIRRDTGGV